MINLELLDLNFDSTKISNEGISYIPINFKKYSIGIKDFSLDISNCVKLTNAGVNELSKGLPELYDLEVLNLRINNIVDLKAKTIYNIHSSLNSSKLEVLNLDYSGCGELNENAYKSLNSAFSNLNEL